MNPLPFILLAVSIVLFTASFIALRRKRPLISVQLTFFALIIGVAGAFAHLYLNFPKKH